VHLMGSHMVMTRGINVVAHNSPMHEDCSGPSDAALIFASQSRVGALQEDHFSRSTLRSSHARKLTFVMI